MDHFKEHTNKKLRWVLIIYEYLLKLSLSWYNYDYGDINLKDSVDDNVVPVLMDKTVREVSPNLPSLGPGMESQWNIGWFFSSNSRFELEDFEIIGPVLESEKEADLDNCEADDEEGGRPLCDHAAMSDDVEVVQHSIVPGEANVLYL